MISFIFLCLLCTLNRHFSSGEKQPTARFVKNISIFRFFLLLNEKLLQLIFCFCWYHFISHPKKWQCLLIKFDSPQTIWKINWFMLNLNLASIWHLKGYIVQVIWNNKIQVYQKRKFWKITPYMTAIKELKLSMVKFLEIVTK